MIGGITNMGSLSASQRSIRYAQTIRPAAQSTPTTPVAPVSPAKAVSPEAGSSVSAHRLPMVREGADPVEMAVRGRIQYPGDPAAQEAQAGKPAKSPRETMEEGECQTCKNRKYQDGSDDPGVSFKTATTIAPEKAAAAVKGHEQEHVVRERAKAQREDRQVVSQSVTIHTAICPECGDTYVSGGTTRTTTKGKAELFQPPKQEAKPQFEAVA